MAETMQGLKRSSRCSEIELEAIGQELVLAGWCHKQRDLGGLIFITLRDRSGEIQLLIDESCPAEVREKAARVRGEFVIAARGVLQKRSAVNPNMKTGEVELKVSELRILSEAKTPPFYIEEESATNEALRLKYRYLDLRRPNMQYNLILRHQITKLARDFLTGKVSWRLKRQCSPRARRRGPAIIWCPAASFPAVFLPCPSPRSYSNNS